MLSPSAAADQRCSIVYQLTATESELRAKAEALCLDQTVEMPADILAAFSQAEHIVGRIESFRDIRPGVAEAPGP